MFVDRLKGLERLDIVLLNAGKDTNREPRV